LTLALIVCFALLAAAGFSRPGLPICAAAHPAKLFRGLPILLCTFGYHQVIPIVCRRLAGDRRAIRWALLTGTAIPLIFAAVLFTLAFRLFPREELLRTARAGLPLFALLRERGTPEFVFQIGRCFSILAILTSILGLSMALHGAVGDLLRPWKKSFAVREMFVLIPLPIALTFPHLFLTVLGLCGGIFGNLIAGLLPTLPFLIGDRFRLRYLALWSVFWGILLIEVIQLLGR
jgi:tyrosine-specific transport protein